MGVILYHRKMCKRYLLLDTVVGVHVNVNVDRRELEASDCSFDVTAEQNLK